MLRSDQDSLDLTITGSIDIAGLAAQGAGSDVTVNVDGSVGSFGTDVISMNGDRAVVTIGAIGVIQGSKTIGAGIYMDDKDGSFSQAGHVMAQIGAF